jgi:hypothetical protein
VLIKRDAGAKDTGSVLGLPAGVDRLTRASAHLAGRVLRLARPDVESAEWVNVCIAIIARRCGNEKT